MLKILFTGQALKFFKMLVLKVIIVNGTGLFLGVPIWLLAISWSLNVFFVYRMVKGVYINYKEMENETKQDKEESRVFTSKLQTQGVCKASKK